MKRFSHYLAKELDLSIEQEEVIDYGLFVFLFNGSSIFLFLIFGQLFHCLKETLLFLICFIPLRLELGGFHSDTPVQCFTVFTALSFCFTVLLWRCQTSLTLYSVTILAIALTMIRGCLHHISSQKLLLLGVSVLVLTLIDHNCQYIVALAILMSLVLFNMAID